MKKILLVATCIALLSGCGISVTTSGLKAGIISEDVVVENGNRVIHEDLVGLRVQWLPYFSWNDVVGWFKKEKKE